jgi:hypothetical protein
VRARPGGASSRAPPAEWNARRRARLDGTEKPPQEASDAATARGGATPRYACLGKVLFGCGRRGAVGGAPAREAPAARDSRRSAPIARVVIAPARTLATAELSTISARHRK